MGIVCQKITDCLDSLVPTKLEKWWNHPAGPKTIHFWAPAFKWGLVIAGIADIIRPADDISVPQTIAIGLTGAIWARYSLVIIPKNWSLFGVNIFVAITQANHLLRAFLCQMGYTKSYYVCFQAPIFNATTENGTTVTSALNFTTELTTVLTPST